jgi:hypothetical protein
MASNNNATAPRPSRCDDDKTHLHSLQCGHSVITSPITGVCTTPSSPKLPCSPNCRRSIYEAKPQLPLSWLKNTHLHPLICPACVKDQVRAQYDELLAEHRWNGGRLTDSMETNVQLWTYGAVLEACDKGGRICEATTGMFRLKYVDGFRALSERKVTADKKWEMRDGVANVEDEEEKERELGLKEDASKIALVAAKESVVGKERDVDMEMDDLADRLFDAKVGVVENDAAVDDLMVGFSRL